MGGGGAGGPQAFTSVHIQGCDLGLSVSLQLHLPIALPGTRRPRSMQLRDASLPSHGLELNWGALSRCCPSKAGCYQARGGSLNPQKVKQQRAKPGGVVPSSGQRDALSDPAGKPLKPCAYQTPNARSQSKVAWPEEACAPSSPTLALRGHPEVAGPQAPSRRAQGGGPWSQSLGRVPRGQDWPGSSLQMLLVGGLRGGACRLALGAGLTVNPKSKQG